MEKSDSKIQLMLKAITPYYWSITMNGKDKLSAKDHNRRLNKKVREDKEKAKEEKILSNISKQELIRRWIVD